jgi:hypothetical protein
MPRVEFEPAFQAFERAKIFPTLDRAATGSQQIFHTRNYKDKLT